MAIQLIMSAMRNGSLEKDVSYYFDIAESIESEAIDRFYIQKSHCDSCKGELKFHDLQGQFRIECDCKSGIGNNYKDAYDKWNEK